LLQYEAEPRGHRQLTRESPTVTGTAADAAMTLKQQHKEQASQPPWNSAPREGQP
jgi:hypothetical protein